MSLAWFRRKRVHGGGPAGEARAAYAFLNYFPPLAGVRSNGVVLHVYLKGHHRRGPGARGGIVKWRKHRLSRLRKSPLTLSAWPHISSTRRTEDRDSFRSHCLSLDTAYTRLHRGAGARHRRRTYLGGAPFIQRRSLSFSSRACWSEASATRPESSAAVTRADTIPSTDFPISWLFRRVKAASIAETTPPIPSRYCGMALINSI
jgi:hypothetical protein